MLDTTLASRYARAFHRITRQAGNTSAVSQELSAFCGLMGSVKLLKKVLYHPEITAAEKTAVVAGMLEGSAEATTIRFISYVIGKKRIFHLESMAKMLAALLAEDENRIAVKVESFGPLSAAMQNRMQEQLAALLQKKVTVNVLVDPSLLGGIRLTFGDKVIDGSVSNQLKNLTRTVTAV